MSSSGFVLFSHIFPIIFAVIGILLIISGIMDEEKSFTILGVILFLIAGLGPYLVLSLFI